LPHFTQSSLTVLSRRSKVRMLDTSQTKEHPTMKGSLALAAICFVGCILGVGPARERMHPGHDLHEWTFSPQSPASQTVGLGASPPGVPAFQDPAPPTHPPLPPIDFKGLHATDRRLDLLSGEHLPIGPFTCELWINHHVSEPVGVLMAARDATHDGDAAWIVGFHDRTALFAAGPNGSTVISSPVETIAHRRHWYHLAAVYTGQDLQLFVNGRQFGGLPIDATQLMTGADSRLEIAAYLENEPLMQLGHLVTLARLYEEALTPSQITKRFAMMKMALDEGWVHPGRMHLSAGPYLRMTHEDSMQVVWETDRMTSALFEWGTDTNVTERIQLGKTPNRIQHATLNKLQPATTYFYRLRATDPSDNCIDTGLLSFRSPPAAGTFARIGVIGATHLRRHISEHLAGQILGRGLDALINLGSLTDGGGKDDKHLWNLEYFQSMGPLHARVPAIVLPGDGDADRFWFDQYHPGSAPDGCTSIRCADAEFFLLGSPGTIPREQQISQEREWLKQHAEASTAAWKIVCHHRAFFSSFEQRNAITGSDQVASLTSLFDVLGIDLVLSAPPGGYERTLAIRGGTPGPDGVVYVNSGGGGADPIDFPFTKPWFCATSRSGHHFLVLDVTAHTLQLTAHGLDGSPIDTLNLAKSAPGERAREGDAAFPPQP
jgi:hypothetical protein